MQRDDEVETPPAPVADWLMGYLRHAPGAVAVVAGPTHALVAANAAFHRLAATRDARADVRAGCSILDACALDGAGSLGALLDRARRTGAPAHAVVADARDDYTDAWQCIAWPAATRSASPSADGGLLVVEVRAASDADRASVRQRDLTERMLMGALHDHELAEEADRARAAAERREAELAAVIESMPDAVYIAGRDRILRANRHALTQLGVATVDGLNAAGGTAVERIGVAGLPRDAASGAAIPPERQPLARALAGATIVEDVLLRDPGTGEDLVVRCAASPVVVDGTVIAAVVVHTDLTAQRRLEAELRQAQKLEAVGRLAGGVAHDFNNLLTAIGTNAELAASTLPPDSAARDDLREVSDAVRRAAALTGQLLAFSRQQVLQPTTLDLATVVTDVERLLTRVLGGAVTLTTRLDPAQPAVVADRGQLEQVLMNLVLNARDAMPTGGTLEIATACVDVLPPTVVPAVPPTADRLPDRSPHGGRALPSWVALRVRDSGQGMDTLTQGRIFEPFYTTKAVGKGTGLGLATVYGIVAQSGGHIGVETAPDRGTAFTIYLPAAHPVAPTVEAPPHPGASAGGADTVLLVDDDAAVRRAVSRLLARQGYTVIEAGSGEEALAVAAQRVAQDHGPHLIRALITDVMMPGMRGPDLADRLRRTMPGLRVLLISGYTADTWQLPELGARAVERDADVAYLNKPFSGVQLGAALRTLLDMPVADAPR